MSINDLISSKVSPTVSNASVQTRPPPVLCNMESQASSDLILCSTKSQTDDAEMTDMLKDQVKQRAKIERKVLTSVKHNPSLFRLTAGCIDSKGKSVLRK